MKSSSETNTPPRPRACGVYVFDAEGRVLFSQRGPAARHEQFKWEAPGGMVEEGESFEDAARREYLEELGMRVTLTDVLLEYDDVADADGTIWQAKIFKGESTDTPTLREPTKVCGFARFTPEELKALHEIGMLASYATKDLEVLGWL